MLLNYRKQKKSLLKHNCSEIKQIYDDYYDHVIFKNEIEGRLYEKKVYKIPVTQILKKYKLASIAELLFLLHHKYGQKIRECEFCGHYITWLGSRTNDKSINDCKCEGLCKECDKVFKIGCGNNDICHWCKQKYYEPIYEKDNSPETLRRRFLMYTGNHDFMNNIKDHEEANYMMKIASEYYYFFKEIYESLKKY